MMCTIAELTSDGICSTCGALEALGRLFKAGLGAHCAPVNTCWPNG